MRRANTTACDGNEAKGAPLRRYQLDEFVVMGDPIGSGSYGMVTKVVHKSTAEIFAMKTITKKKVLEHKMTSYLMREVKTQIKVQHPNILRLVYYFEDAENVYLLLEYAKGGSLFSVMRKRGRLPEPEAARLFVDVSSALDQLHRSGIVHRDLKPENILMCDNDVAKLADFGWCAELTKDGGLRHTFCGTWDYLSPEMVNNEPHDFTVDIWAMGVLLFEMLTGRPPFAAASQMKAMTRITKVDLQIPESVSSGARDLISKLIVKERRRRLSLADAVRHYWVTCYVPNADQKVKQPPPPEIATTPPAGGALSPRAKHRATPNPVPPLAGWDLQPEPGGPVGWGGGKAAPVASPDTRTDYAAQGKAVSPSPPMLTVPRTASPSKRGGAAWGAKESPPASPLRPEAREAKTGSQSPVRRLGKELAHLPSPGSSLGSSLAPLGASKTAWTEVTEVEEQRQGSGSGARDLMAVRLAAGFENSPERPPALPIASTIAAGSTALKPTKLNDFIKKHLDGAGDPTIFGDAGAPSSGSTSSAGNSDVWRTSPSTSANGPRLPANCTSSLQTSALSEASLHPAAPELSQTMPIPVVREAEMGWASPPAPALTPGAPKEAPQERPRLQGSPTPEERGRQERWQDTNTFAAIRNWVRKNSAVTTPLGEELDKTLPVGAVVSNRDDLLGSHPDSLFSLPVTSGDQLAPLPKRRAANPKRRATAFDTPVSSAWQLASAANASSTSPASGGALGDSGAAKGDSFGSSSSTSPVASALHGLRSGAGTPVSPGVGTLASAAGAGTSAAGADAVASAAGRGGPMVLAALPQTLAVPSLAVAATPRLQEVRDLATRMQDLRSQIDRDLDSSCNALKKHFEQRDFATQGHLWKDFQEVTMGKAMSENSGAALLGRKRCEFVAMAGLTEAAADEAAGHTAEAAAADRAAGVAAVGMDTFSNIQQEKAGRTLWTN